MIQIIPQTRDEKIAMYLKLTKRELAEMLFAANEVFVQHQPIWDYSVRPTGVVTLAPPPNTCGAV